MSKSLGNFLDPEAIDNYIHRFSLDALRYFLATRGPLGVSDSAFSPDLFIEVYNSDLANTFGNSCSRVASMIAKYFNGKLPEALPESDKDYIRFQMPDVASQYERHFNALNLGPACEVSLLVVREVDAFIEMTQTFRMAREPANLPAAATVLYQCAEALRIASLFLWPFIPDACEEFWRRFGCAQYSKALTNNGAGNLNVWLKWGQLMSGTSIEKGDPLFPRYQVQEG
jgi:methionyl-tRNA synthetase